MQILRETHEISWIIGAGENGFGGLVRNSGLSFRGAPIILFQSTTLGTFSRI